MKAVIIIIVFVLGLTGCDDSTKKVQPLKEAPLKQTTEEQNTSGTPTPKRTEEGAGVENSDNTESDTEDYVMKEGTTKTDVYDSKAIADNLIKEETRQYLNIYLPPTYEEGVKSYPVIYFLHGFGDSPAAFISHEKRDLDEAFSKDPSKEFIMVAVDGSNALGGSYYVNSPVIGKWEDYTVKEVVTYIDQNYRTIADVKSRGICGFSMGGFGALNLAFLHPDVYGAVYAMSPGVLAPGKIGDALDTWKNDRVFLKAYSQAFAYNTEPPYETLPLRDGSDTDNALLARWESGFGDWIEKLDTYIALKTPLRAIGISYGTVDGYGWIPEGCEYLSGLLKEAGIEHTLFSFSGGHSLPPELNSEHLLPFFYDALVWDSEQ